jgi:sigma-B regulation protein RsbU (phosphoserine phosphatase)
MHDGSLGLVVADVSGHGFGSALLMASTHAHLRSLATAFDRTDDIVARTNALLCTETEDDRFVTMLLARLDPQSRSLWYVNAGHPAGCVLDASGAVKATLDSTALPLGVVADEDFPSGGPIALEPGDLVLLLTDGVLEARSPEGAQFGVERTLDVVRAARYKSAAEIIEGLREAVCRFAWQSKLPDDLTALVVKVEPVPAASPPPARTPSPPATGAS